MKTPDAIILAIIGALHFPPNFTLQNIAKHPYPDSFHSTKLFITLIFNYLNINVNAIYNSYKTELLSLLWNCITEFTINTLLKKPQVTIKTNSFWSLLDKKSIIINVTINLRHWNTDFLSLLWDRNSEWLHRQLFNFNRRKPHHWPCLRKIQVDSEQLFQIQCN